MVMTHDSDLDPPIPLVDHCEGRLFDGPLRPDRLPPVVMARSRGWH